MKKEIKIKLKEQQSHDNLRVKTTNPLIVDCTNHRVLPVIIVIEKSQVCKCS